MGRRARVEVMTEEQWQLTQLVKREIAVDINDVEPSPWRPNKGQTAAHVRRWWDAGMSVEEIVEACGYKRTTVERALAR